MLAAAAAAAVALATTPMEDKLQAILDRNSKYFNTSFSLGLYSGQREVTALVAGVSDRATGKKLTVDMEFPMGSVTKSYVAVAVMRLEDQGFWNITDPVHLYADPILKRQNGTTLLELFGDPRINDVTLEHLLQMRGGLQDYNDPVMRAWTVDHPHQDFSPFDYLHALNKTLLCKPGTCGSYSSLGFVVLGFALAEAAGAQTWQQYSQLAAVPFTTPKNNTRFLDAGPCSRYKQVVHQYFMDKPKTGGTPTVHDIDGCSCLNGWTMGNIAAAPADVAGFYYNLLSANAVPRLVSEQSYKKMTHWIPLSAGWSAKLDYGLGLMNFTSFSPAFLLTTVPVGMVGHGGADWGSQADMTGYSPSLDMGICLAMGSASGLNMSTAMTSKSKNAAAYTVAFCEIYSALQEDRGQEPLDCPGFQPRDSNSCVCPAETEYCGSNDISWNAPYGCNDTLNYLADSYGIDCKHLTVYLNTTGKLKPTQQSCCAPPGKCRSAGACLCPAGTSYVGGNVFPRNPPYTCEQTIDALRKEHGLSCQAVPEYLKATGLLPSTLEGCCSPPVVPREGNCLCDSPTMYNGSAAVPHSNDTCEDIMEYLEFNHSTQCAGVKQWMAEVGQLPTWQGWCCGLPDAPAGECLCDKPSDYNGSAVMPWNAPYSCEQTMAFLLVNETTDCSGVRKTLAKAHLLANSTASCCKGSL